MNRWKAIFFLTLLTLLLVALGRAVGGVSGMAGAFVLAAAMNFGTYWYADRVVLRLYGAREVSAAEEPRLHGVVRRLAQHAGLPMPRVYVIPSASPNAFATGRNPDHAAVAATQGLLERLDDAELEGVMAHELAHVRNRDTLIATLAATVAGAISMLANLLQLTAIFGGGRSEDDEGGGSLAGGLALALIAPLVALVVQMAVSRSREYLADETGARISRNPSALASALRTLHRACAEVPLDRATPATAHLFIVSPLRGGALAGLFSTHPPVGERIARLEALGRRAA